MSFEKIVPVWRATGVEPPDSLKSSGFQPGYKPPAEYFNWFFQGVSAALSELQSMTNEDIGAAISGLVYRKYTVDTEEEIEEAIAAAYAAMPDNSVDFITMFVAASNLSIPGGGAHIALYRTTSTYGTLMATSYSAPAVIKCRVLKAGVWQDWTKIAADHKHSADDISGGTLPVERGGTGASSAATAREKLAVPATLYYDGDMNDLVTSGFYRLNENANLPDGVNDVNVYYGQAIVSRGSASSNTCAQIVIDYNSGVVVYRAGYNNGTAWTWRDWATFYSTGNKPTVEELGAAPQGLVASKYTVATEEAIDQALSTVYSGMTDHSSRFMAMFVSANGLSLVGGGWHFVLHRTNATYGTAIGTAYSAGSAIKIRHFTAGAWGDWNTIAGRLPTVTSADDGKVLQVVGGVWTAMDVGGSAIGEYIDSYISSALEGDY